jgi:dipeptidyl aminopeptidase/acylaminoacyl peptidase
MVLIGAMAVATAGLGPDAGASNAGKNGTIPAPEGLPAFYAVPKKLPAKPGTLIKSARVDVGAIEGTVYRVMYTTKSLQGKPLAVTGVVMVPPGDAPEGGWPVLTWEHGTNGMADECAGSLDVSGSTPFANRLLAQGWLLAATDYEGEGTPGLHPYIAGESSARDSVDIVRAARRLKGAHPSKSYVAWGHSQGGHTAMFTLKFGESYAPELDLKGVVAGAPPSQFNLLYDFLKTSPFKHYLLMAAGGLNAAYGDKAAPLDKVLTPKGIELLALLDQGCSSYVADKVKDIPFDEVTKTDPFTVPEWKKLLTENDPQQFSKASDVPLLIIHGGSDEQIPTVASELMATHLCGLDQNLVRWVYPGQSHAGVIGPSLDDMIQWINNRFAGEANPDAYAPTGQPDVQVTRCPA